MTLGFAACLAGDVRRYRELTRGIAAEAPLSLADRLRILSPRLLPNLLIRAAHALDGRGLGPIAKLVSIVAFVAFGLEFAVRCPIGPGLFLPHTQGTVIGAATIGCNATIFQGVTLGARELDFGFDLGTRPIVEDNVLIGAGAKILGGVTLGAGCKVGANAIVIESLAPGTVALAPVARQISAFEQG